MGKVVGTVLKVAGAIAIGVVTLNPEITVAILGTTFSATAIAIAGSAATLAGTLLDPPSANFAETADQGTLLNSRVDSTAPRRILYGIAAFGGTFLYRETTGPENEKLHLVMGLAGHKMTSLEGFKFGGENVTFDGLGNAQGKYAGKMSLKFHDGDDAQEADAGLVAASSKWTNNHKLGGLAYVYLKLVWDHEVFPQDLEKIHFTLKGRKLYDPRKDPTKGGVGSHDLNDETTWEWSCNPILAMTDYLMGIRVAGKFIAGMGISPDRIDWANVMAEASICDESVALKDGGVEPRYTLNGWVDPNREHRANLSALSSSCGGAWVFQSGKWRCYVASQRTAVKARTADHVVGSLQMQAKKSTSAKVNSIRGLFADPSADYELKDFPPLQSQTYIAEDGGTELWREVNLPYTKSPAMAQRLSKISLERARMEKTIKANFTLVALEDQAMDVISFSHDRFNISNQNMICTDWRLAVSQTKDGAEGLVVECTLVEDNPNIYAWAPAVEEEVMPIVPKVDTPDRIRLPLDKHLGAVNYWDQVSGNTFSEKFLGFGDLDIGFGSYSKPDTNASYGAVAGQNLLDEIGVALTDDIVKNENTLWTHLSGKSNAPADNATAGATWGLDISGEPMDLAGLNPTEGAKLSGIAPSSDVTSVNFLSAAIQKGLPVGIGIDQGNGFRRSAPMGFAEGFATDGLAVNFGQAWDVLNLPIVKWGVGGLAYDSGGTLVGDQVQSFKALNLSASGFTAELKLQGQAGTGTPVTNTGSVETSADVWELHKSTASEAWDDNYTFQIDVSVFAGEYIAEIGIYFGTMTVGFYTNDGTGWVQRSTATYASSSSNESTFLANQKKTVVVDGLGNHAGYEFKVLIESKSDTSSTIVAFDSVSYETASLPAKISATPVGVSPVGFTVNGGMSVL